MSAKLKGRFRVSAALFLGTAVLAGGAVAAYAASSFSSPDAVSYNLSGDATPGHVKVGQVITFTVSTRASVKYQLSMQTPDGSEPMNPSQPLKNEVGAPSVWTPGAGPRKLTFSVTVNAPPGAKGSGLWCMQVAAAPSFGTKTPAAWIRTQTLCYLATLQ